MWYNSQELIPTPVAGKGNVVSQLLSRKFDPCAVCTITLQYDMHMVSIRVRYGFRWHSDKPYRTSRRRVRYGLSECHLNPYRTRMDIICIFSHEITINLSFTTKKHIIEISQPPLQTTECDMASDQNCA